MVQFTLCESVVGNIVDYFLTKVYLAAMRKVALAALQKKKNGESRWSRTIDPYIKSVLLYQLSYGLT